MDENIRNLDFLGTKHFFPVVSTAFCGFKNLGRKRQRRPFAAAAGSHESSNARAQEAELVVELPPSEEDTTVVESLAEINLIERIAFET